MGLGSAAAAARAYGLYFPIKEEHCVRVTGTFNTNMWESGYDFGGER
jgi:hypothetical protein